MDIKEVAANLARYWISENAIIIDTETTGLGDTDEIIEISAIDCNGNLLIDQLVKPTVPIIQEAQAVHGISQADLASAPEFRHLMPALCRLLRNRQVVTYNAEFDLRMMRQSASAWGWQLPKVSAHCAMLQYAKFYGEWNPNRNAWRWQSLAKAAEQQGIQVHGDAHRALTDCQTTLAVIQAMANYRPEAA